MAWFKCGGGGGGIPAALRNAMNAVLNKKFGTSETYAPETWPDTVNLMGPLEEKTVSGAIASFSDGADDVPLKSCAVTIAPTLDGVSSVDVVSAGKNFISLLDWLASGYSYTHNGVTFTVQNDGGIRIQGKSTSTSDFNILALAQKSFYAPKNGVYTLSASGIVANVKLITSGANNNGFPYKEVTNTNTSQTGTVTDATKPFNYLLVRVSETVNTLDVVIYPQLEVGSTATTYAPYVTPTTHTATLGRTIYGGEVDVVNGQGTDGYIKYVIDGVNVYGYLTGSNNMNIMPYGLNIDGTISKWLCDTLTANSTNFGYNSNQGYIFIRQAGWSSIPNVTDEATFNAYCQENPITLILPLATAETFTFDHVPIDSKLGNNTMWSDGDLEVIYRSMGTVYQYPEGEEVYF